jgi:hypothetical protein
MSNSKSLHGSFGFGEAPTERLSALGNTVRVYWEAFRDGLAAARAYEELIARGVPHHVAVQHIFRDHLRA